MFECTQSALDSMIARLDDMEGRQRQELLMLVQQSQEDETNSDENAGFRDAHQQLQRLEMDIAAVREKIGMAVVVAAESDGRVRVGSEVTLDLHGEPWELMVGHIIERSDRDIVSPSSPLGQALIGAAAGDTITWASPGGTLTATVRAVL